MNPKPEPINSLTQEEIDKLLLGDYAVDEAPPEKVMEVRDTENSKVMEVRDRHYDNAISVLVDIVDTYLDTSISDDLAQEILEELEAMGWEFRQTSSTLEVGDLLDDDSKVPALCMDEREEAYRESIREIRRESNERIKSLSKLITRLYLDLWHIEQIANALMEVCDSYSPEDLKAIASLITHTGMRGRQAISSHTETDHYPQTLIKHNHESPAT